MKTIAKPVDPLLDDEKAAGYLGLVPGTLRAWRHLKSYKLAYVKVGRRVFYRLSELEKFLESRTVRNGETAS